MKKSVVVLLVVLLMTVLFVMTASATKPDPVNGLVRDSLAEEPFLRQSRQCINYALKLHLNIISGTFFLNSQYVYERIFVTARGRYTLSI